MGTSEPSQQTGRSALPALPAHTAMCTATNQITEVLGLFTNQEIENGSAEAGSLGKWGQSRAQARDIGNE